MTNRPFIKICGLTLAEEAVACAALGADAIGLVFYPKSPRNVSEKQARAITDALPEHVISTGVFVNESFEIIMEKVSRCGLKAVQLHGGETPGLVKHLRAENLIVIKVLYMENEPRVDTSNCYDPSAFLIECSKGVLPGGNALSWDYRSMGKVTCHKPVIIAGGLSPDNIREAVLDAEPDGVDVSSGVERHPGLKDLARVEALITAVKACDIGKKIKEII